MGRVISICSQKGGVGKTTTAINLAASFSNLSKKVLLIDIDPSANTSKGFGLDVATIDNNVFNVLTNKISLKKSLQKINPNLDLISSSFALMQLQDHFDSEDNKLFSLKEKLDTIKDNYDYIFIDCPPTLGVLTNIALCASDSVLIPVQCESFSMQSITQLLGLISNIQSNINPKLVIEGFVVTMFDVKSNLHASLYQDIKLMFRENLFSTIIPRNISIPESILKGIPVVYYRPTSSGSYAYIALAREIIDKDENNF